MAKMSSALPARKVAAATVAAGVATILVWILNTFLFHSPEQKIDQTIAGSITTVLVGIAGYFTPSSSDDRVVS